MVISKWPAHTLLHCDEPSKYRHLPIDSNALHAVSKLMPDTRHKPGHREVVTPCGESVHYLNQSPIEMHGQHGPAMSGTYL